MRSDSHSPKTSSPTKSIRAPNANSKTTLPQVVSTKWLWTQPSLSKQSRRLKRHAYGKWRTLPHPAFMGWDVGALKNFSLAPEDRVRLQFHAEFFNVLNHTNLNNPTSATDSGNFGKILGSQDPRIGQLALKLVF